MGGQALRPLLHPDDHHDPANDHGQTVELTDNEVPRCQKQIRRVLYTGKLQREIPTQGNPEVVNDEAEEAIADQIDADVRALRLLSLPEYEPENQPENDPLGKAFVELRRMARKIHHPLEL